MTLPVIEIFESIDGEGIFTGRLATFIRLAGCNLRCAYCDTRYAYDRTNASEMEPADIVRQVERHGCPNITLTGGEPLIHSETLELVKQLTAHGFGVNIETNGSMDISQYTLPGVTITMDYKTKASGENEKMLLSNIAKLRNSDVLKFVLGKGDLETLRTTLISLNPSCEIYFSPVFGEVNAADIVEEMKKMSLDEKCAKFIFSARVQLQLHKYIWDPEMRGV